MNLSNLSEFMPVTAQMEPVFILDVLRDVCTQIDDKIILIWFLMLTFQLILRTLVPSAWTVVWEMAPKIFKPWVDKIFRAYYEITDSLVLLSMVFGSIILWNIGLDPKYQVWGYVLIVIFVVAVLVNVLDFVRNGGFKRMWNNIKRMRRKLENN